MLKKNNCSFFVYGSLFLGALMSTIIPLFAQTVVDNKAPFPKVKTPKNIDYFIKDNKAAIQLGKAFFWDMQAGSDGIVACASCHFNAFSDNRKKNQLHPGPDNYFSIKGLNQTVGPSDFPIQSDDIFGSQGVIKAKFKNILPTRGEEIYENIFYLYFYIVKYLKIYFGIIYSAYTINKQKSHI